MNREGLCILPLFTGNENGFLGWEMMIETEKVTTLKAKHQSKSSTSLSRFERIGYGFGDMSYNIIFQFVNAYLLFYYTDVGGIQPAVIATLFLVVRVLDAILTRSWD